MAAVVAAVLAVASPASAFIGDVSGDDRVDTLDARLIAGFLVGTSTSVPRPENADVNNDGLITTADALLIMQVSKGLRTSFASNALEVLAVMPSSGTTGVQLTANFSVFFSEPVLSGSLSGIILTDTVTSLPVVGSFSPSQDGVIATFVPGQPLQPSRLYRINVTTAVKDNGGHELAHSFQSTFQTQVLGTGILVSTNGLSARINELAPQPVVFRALNNLGVPVKQVPVTFTAKMGSGVFEPSKSRQIVVLTDDTGFARSDFRLGGEAVLHTVEATAVGFSTVPMYTALALPMPAANLRIYSGNSQNGAPGTTAPFHLIAQATDVGGNSVAGTTITFNVIQGQGNFGGQPTVAIPTDSSGTARVAFTFGTTTGPVSVQASFLGLVGQAPTFSLLNLAPQPSSPTVITGRAIDANTLLPINHIYVYFVDNPSIWDWTDEFGAFSLTTIPGSHVVSVNGFESGPIGGVQYPVIAIPVNAVQGQINDISMPALLPQLDPLSYIDVSDTQGGTLTLRADPRWQMYVAPGQARFANGTGTGRLYVASVPPDRIPMPVAGGKTSRFFDTIQPLNVAFDPPAQVSFPNADNLPAGTVTDIFTLSYTSGTFVRTGRGQVSEDGQLVRSLPGEGITQGGWHNSPSPRPDPTTCLDGGVADGEGKGIPACTVTYAGISAITDSEGRYRFCNVPANNPSAPIISCPVSDQCSIDTDHDGFCDEFERRHGGGSGGGGGGDGPPPEDDPDEKPDIKIKAYPSTLYLADGEAGEIFVRVEVDNQTKAGEFVSLAYEPPGVVSGPSQVMTADDVVMQLVRNPAAAPVAAVAMAHPGVRIAGGVLSVLYTAHVVRRRFTEGKFLVDTNVIQADINECDEPAGTKFVVGAFLALNRTSGNLFASRSVLGEMERRKVLNAGGNCVEQLYAGDTEKIGFLAARGIVLVDDILNGAEEDQIIGAVGEFNEAGGAGMFGPTTQFRAILLSAVDVRMMVTAIEGGYRFATNDAGVLRIDNRKSTNIDALPINPCIPPIYPKTLSGQFCGSNGALP